MKQRNALRNTLSASRLIAMIKIKDTLLSPGFYILLTISLVTAFAYIQGFVRIIEGDGLNFSLHPLYTLTSRVITGLPGEEFQRRLFASGPGLLTTLIPPLPFMLFILVTSVLSRGLDRENRVIELLAYGPVNETAYSVSSLISDLTLTGLMIISLVLFAISALLSFNLALGSHFFTNHFLLIILLFPLSAFGILLSALIKNTMASVISYCAVLLGLFGLELFFYSAAEVSLRNILLPFHMVLRWISPFYYFRIGAAPFSAGGLTGLVFSFAGNVSLGVVLLFFASSFAQRKGLGR